MFGGQRWHRRSLEMPYGAAEPSTDKRDRHIIGDMLLLAYTFRSGRVARWYGTVVGVNFLTWFLQVFASLFAFLLPLLYFATTDRQTFLILLESSIVLSSQQ